jgi:hypothetical protein
LVDGVYIRKEKNDGCSHLPIAHSIQLSGRFHWSFQK